MTKKDNNQVIWEEFVSQNKIKKNYSRGGSISFNVVDHRAPDVVEEFRSNPKADMLRLYVGDGFRQKKGCY